MESNDMSRFRKLTQMMKDPSGRYNSPNGDLDWAERKQSEGDRQLSLIDAKISELENSDDPNALESLNFWKSKRAEIAGD